MLRTPNSKIHISPAALLVPLEFTIIAVGIFFRIAQYLTDRAVWGDEWFLLENLLTRSYTQLFLPLTNGQSAPIGFLLIEKLAIDLFGFTNELGLRLFPLMIGIASLLVFRSVALRLLPRPAVWLALMLFAINPSLIYYASEIKQYGLDVLVALLILLLYSQLRAKPLTWRRAVLAALAGALCVLFSQTAVFVLATISAALLTEWATGNGAQLWKVLPMFGVWGASFLWYYLALLAPLSTQVWLLDFWAAGFPEPGIRSVVVWSARQLSAFIRENLNLQFPQLALIAVGIGAAAALRRARLHALVLILPFALVLGAAALQRYPFVPAFPLHRLILFLFPFAFLLAAFGLWVIVDGLRQHVPWLARAALVAYLFLPVLSLDTVTFGGDVRPVVQGIQDRMQPDDTFYVPIFYARLHEYYFMKYGIEPQTYIVGSVAELQAGDVVFEPGTRVWLMRTALRATVPDWLDSVVYFDAHGDRVDMLASNDPEAELRYEAYLYIMR